MEFLRQLTYENEKWTKNLDTFETVDEEGEDAFEESKNEFEQNVASQSSVPQYEDQENIEPIHMPDRITRKKRNTLKAKEKAKTNVKAKSNPPDNIEPIHMPDRIIRKKRNILKAKANTNAKANPPEAIVKANKRKSFAIEDFVIPTTQRKRKKLI